MTTTYGELRTEKEKLYDAEVLARVKAGIKWLEETVGPSWVDKIDIGTLSLTHGSRCVLGQVFSAEGNLEEIDGYDWAIGMFPDELVNSGEAHGFYTEDGYWSALQACWEDVLTPMVKVV